MTREELRRALLDGIDRLQHSVAWHSRFLSEDDRHRALGARILWSRDNQRVNDVLDDYCEILSNIHMSPDTEGGTTVSKKTLSSSLKSAFQGAGISLTPEQEHVAQEAADAGKIDWAAVIQKLATIATKIVPIIIAVLAGDQPPAAHASAASCCDHHQCCCDTMKAILHAADVCSKHLCSCCCD